MERGPAPPSAARGSALMIRRISSAATRGRTCMWRRRRHRRRRQRHRRQRRRSHREMIGDVGGDHAIERFATVAMRGEGGLARASRYVDPPAVRVLLRWKVHREKPARSRHGRPSALGRARHASAVTSATRLTLRRSCARTHLGPLPAHGRGEHDRREASPLGVFWRVSLSRGASTAAERRQARSHRASTRTQHPLSWRPWRPSRSSRARARSRARFEPPALALTFPTRRDEISRQVNWS